ncbi:MAG: hemolysin family protein [Sulfolobales archaeon]
MLEVFELIVISILLFLSFLVTLFEISLFSSDRIRLILLKEKRVFGVSTAIKLLRRSHETINSIIVINILANTGIAILLTHVFTTLYGEQLGDLLALVVGTLLIVLIGESIPKTLGVTYRESIASRLATIMYPLIKIFTPIASSLAYISSKIVSPLSVRVKRSVEGINEDELRIILKIAEKSGAISRDERILINRIMMFMDRRVEDIMIPIKDLVLISLHDNIEKIVEYVRVYGHSRYPVFDKDINNIIGFVHVKDLIVKRCDTSMSIRDLLRPIGRVYNDVKLLEALRIMRKTRSHMLIVTDYNNNVLGAVTLEDLIEEIFGEIYDEYDLFPSSRTKLST